MENSRLHWNQWVDFSILFVNKFRGFTFLLKLFEMRKFTAKTDELALENFRKFIWQIGLLALLFTIGKFPGMIHSKGKILLKLSQMFYKYVWRFFVKPMSESSGNTIQNRAKFSRIADGSRSILSFFLADVKQHLKHYQNCQILVVNLLKIVWEKIQKKR